MKIEILPESSGRSKGSKAEEGFDWSFGWILDTVLGSFRTVVDSVAKSIADGVEEILTRAAKRAFLVLLVAFGFIYLLNGFAKVLNVLYGVDGMGELLVGSVVLATSFFLSIVWKR